MAIYRKRIGGVKPDFSWNLLSFDIFRVDFFGVVK